MGFLHSCRLCHDQLHGHSSAIEHVIECMKEHIPDGEDTIYTIVIKDVPKKAGKYFVVLNINRESSLQDLDTFIRKLWMEECCPDERHDSSFVTDLKIRSKKKMTGDQRLRLLLNAQGTEYSTKDTDLSTIPLKDVVTNVGTTIKYTYDPKTPTHVFPELLAVTKGTFEVGKVEILSRNTERQMKCSICGCTAELVTDNSQFVCSLHGSTEEDCSLICNSPRMGQCAYNGEDPSFDTFKINKKRKKHKKEEPLGKKKPRFTLSEEELAELDAIDDTF
jgi:hypothetical protein